MIWWQFNKNCQPRDRRLALLPATSITSAASAGSPAAAALTLFLRMHLRRAILRRSSLLALLLPVAELVLIVPGLGCVSFLHRRCGLGLRMRPALRTAAVVVLVHPPCGGRGTIAVLPDAAVRPPAAQQSAAADAHRDEARRPATLVAASAGLTGCCGRASGRSIPLRIQRLRPCVGLLGANISPPAPVRKAAGEAPASGSQPPGDSQSPAAV